MDLVSPPFSAPAKRLVLLVADGLRADKFFEPDSEGNFRAPFLRSVIKNQGRWGVSHARPPTESRPGHVAIIAGFYEDPSAVTKEASFLDEWSFDQFQSLLNRSNEDLHLKKLLQQDNLVIFLHLLGCDSNGHAHRPFSSIYLNNVKVVDHIAKRVYNLLESYYKDNRTSYIFTADHGMSDKGSHGDGHPSNTDTPLVAWGAGIKHPKPISRRGHSDHVLRFVDEHLHDTPTPKEWGLNGIERVDVNQADIAPLMSTLLGLPCPVNSVGNLPLGYVDMKEEEEVEAVLANTKQILNQFLCKSQLKRASSLYFKPFKPLAHYSSLLNQIEDLLSARDYKAAMQLSENLRSLALKGLHYFQTYDWLMLMTIITLGYIGWMVFLVLHVLQAYTSLLGDIYRKEEAVRQKYNTGKVMSIIASGAIIILIGLTAKWLDLHADGNKYWLGICKHDMKQSRFPMLFHFQALLVGLSSVMVFLSTSHRTEKQELHAIHQLMNWSLAGFSMVLPLFSNNGLLSRLNSIFLGFAPTFLLLSIGKNLVEHVFLENDVRYLRLSDMVLFNVAFFGTGNFASITCFEISSVYRFITVFSPFLMAALLIFKLFIPFMLVICAFSAITKLLQVQRLGCYFLVILFSDVMTIHFFFLVRNTGCWMEIGNSISHFGIVSAQVVFVLVLFALTNIYTKDIQIRSARASFSKTNVIHKKLESVH
ncbi:hypothetical protein CRYUN_Cryun17cG0025900 [Craigia yunnanensis]